MVTMRWSLHRRQEPSGRQPHREGDLSALPTADSLDEGTGQLITNADGIALADWRPFGLRGSEAVGDLISLHLEWIGPTRERVVKQIDIPVAISEVLPPPRLSTTFTNA